jgi:hypothetical protein
MHTLAHTLVEIDVPVAGIGVRTHLCGSATSIRTLFWALCTGMSAAIELVQSPVWNDYFV